MLEVSPAFESPNNEIALTLGSGTPRLYLDLGKGLFLQ